MESLTLQRMAQRSFDIKGWLNAKSEYGSRLMGEPVSRMTVLKVNLGTVAIMAVAIMAGYIE